MLRYSSGARSVIMVASTPCFCRYSARCRAGDAGADDPDVACHVRPPRCSGAGLPIVGAA